MCCFAEYLPFVNKVKVMLKSQQSQQKKKIDTSYNVNIGQG